MHPYTLILLALQSLQRENAELKKQIETMKLQNVSESVADHVEEWLNKSYEGKSERQDIEDFAKEISRYIHGQLKA